MNTDMFNKDSRLQLSKTWRPAIRLLDSGIEEWIGLQVHG